MKPFKINRNSWHYKFNKNFFNNDDYCMERRWEPKHNNFCSYWRATMGRVLVAAILGSTVIGCLAGLAYITYHDPIATVSILGTVAGFGATVVGGVAFLQYLENRKKANAKKPDSLFVQKYKAHKAKICPMVEYD
jgi:hypothetical protein